MINEDDLNKEMKFDSIESLIQRMEDLEVSLNKKKN